MGISNTTLLKRYAYDVAIDSILLPFTLQTAVWHYPAQVNSLPKNNLVAETIRVYPNPSNDLLSIEPPTGQAIHALAVFDMAGKSVLERSWKRSHNSIKLPIKHLPKGMYVLWLEASDDTYQLKFLKQ